MSARVVRLRALSAKCEAARAVWAEAMQAEKEQLDAYVSSPATEKWARLERASYVRRTAGEAYERTLDALHMVVRS